MPGFNGTGPMGAGPLTGGGSGFCITPYRRRAVAPNFSRRPGYLSNFFPFGFGSRGGRGGRCRRFWW